MPSSVGASNSGVLTTSNNTPQTAVQMSVYDDSAAVVTVRVAAFRPSNGNSRTWQLQFGVKQIGSNAPVVINGVVNVISSPGDLGALAWDVSIDVISGLVSVQVKGGSGYDVIWVAEITGQIVIN